jgi:hypothetical protein
MARDGDVRAQREYGAWLRRLAKSRRAYREAAENEEVETMAGFGYEVRACVCAYVWVLHQENTPVRTQHTHLCMHVVHTENEDARLPLLPTSPPPTHTHTRILTTTTKRGAMHMYITMLAGLCGRGS